MIKQLTKHGNSWAVVIDRPVMDLLKIEPETPLEITTDGRVLTITPVVDDSRQKKFDAALSKTNRKFGRALKKLAE